MATNKLQWKRIAKGDKLPCQSFLRKKNGEILKLFAGVTVGQDAYYLPVDEVINVIKDYPIEESKDEMIKEKIIATIHLYYGEPLEKEAKEMIAWLKKQGEQNLANPAKTCKDGQKPTDKVEPKFKIEKGKWYVCIKDLLDNYANKAFRKGDTYLSTQDGSLMPSNSNVPFEVVCPDTYFRDWTIQDAKAGDVLEFGDHGRLVVGIISFVNERTGKVDVSCLLEDNTFKIGNFYTLDTINPHPATKEHRDTLFAKMKEAGYEWDAEKKELKKIEQKPAWSEEDLNKYDFAIRAIGLCKQYAINNQINGYSKLSDTPQRYEELLSWFKSLKDRVQPQPKQEWSGGDEEKINEIIDYLDYKGHKTDVEFLKSLRDRFTWRPSEEQINALNYVVNLMASSERPTENDLYYNILKSLKEQLKRLREE